MIVTANNPNPELWPTLGVWQNREQILVSATFPGVPAFTCDAWCYESAVDFIDAQPLDGGRLQLHHRVREHPNLVLLTIVTPEPDAVEFVARIEPETPASKMPEDLLVPNLCWQLKRAPTFASVPEPYPEFVKRCFIFTDAGLTFLHQTERLKIPHLPAEDPKNNPVWVQMYLPVWEPLRRAPSTAWADYSRDRYIYPVIGAISRDGQYLAAIANDMPKALCQAWHDCMHNNPAWLPDEERREPIWRLKIYAMENNPDKLLECMGRDFPHALTLKERRVPAEVA